MAFLLKIKVSRLSGLIKCFYYGRGLTSMYTFLINWCWRSTSFYVFRFLILFLFLNTLIAVRSALSYHCYYFRFFFSRNIQQVSYRFENHILLYIHTRNIHESKKKIVFFFDCLTVACFLLFLFFFFLLLSFLLCVKFFPHFVVRSNHFNFIMKA